MWEIWPLLFSIKFLCKYVPLAKICIFLSQDVNNFIFIKFGKFGRRSMMKSSPDLLLWVQAAYQTFSETLVPSLPHGGTRPISLPRWCIPPFWAWSNIKQSHYPKWRIFDYSYITMHVLRRWTIWLNIYQIWFFIIL